MNKDELKELAMKQVETVLFNSSRDIRPLQIDNSDYGGKGNNDYLMYKNLLMKQVSEHFEKLRDKCNT